MEKKDFPWIIAITGASGVIYARRLLQVIAFSLPSRRFEVVISESAKRVLREEEADLGLDFSNENSSKDNNSWGNIRWGGEEWKKVFLGVDASNLFFHSNRDIGAGIASGSYRTEGMVVVPCSMSTMAAVSCGLSEKLIHRAADVTLKERRKLIIVPRETPLSTIQIENMLKLSRLGVVVMPAMPGFYHRPKSIGDMVDHLVIRILDHMGLSDQIEIKADLPISFSRWKENASS